jgi:putative oxidoreductase
MRFLSRFEAMAYDLLRFMAGALYSVHGMQKLFGVLTSQPMPPAGSQAWVGGIIELVCGILIAIGLFTRPAAFIASGEMAVAFFQFHFQGVFANWNWVPHVNGGELAVLYCFIFYVSTRGGGRFGFDSQVRHPTLSLRLHPVSSASVGGVTVRPARSPPRRRTPRIDVRSGIPPVPARSPAPAGARRFLGRSPCRGWSCRFWWSPTVPSGRKTGNGGGRIARPTS